MAAASVDELAWLRGGALPPPLVARLHAHLQALDANTRDELAAALGAKYSPSRRASELRSDLSQPSVAYVDGELRWTGAWRIDGAPPNLCFARDVCPHPLPGPMRLYVLARSGIVVGVERQGDGVAAYRATLLALQRLPFEEIAALREGRPSRRARAQIEGAARTMFLFAPVVLLFGAVMVLVPYLLDQLGAHVTGLDPWLPILGALIALTSVGLVVKGFKLRALRDAPLRTVEGPARAYTSGSGKHRVQYVNVAGEKFGVGNNPVAHAVYDAIIPDWPCRAWTSADGEVLVAVEPIGDEPRYR